MFKELPEFVIRTGSKAGQQCTASTAKLYKQRLNRLAKEGYDCKAKLIENPQETISKIEELEPKNDDIRRSYLSAIFHVIRDIPLEDQEPFIKAFRANYTQYREYLKQKTASNAIKEEVEIEVEEEIVEVSCWDRLKDRLSRFLQSVVPLLPPAVKRLVLPVPA